MIHKIRKAVRDRDARYKLKHIIEMDDSYFGSSAAGKRGRGAANKSTVVVVVENRFNRRFNEFQITDRLLTACLNISTIT